SARTGPPNKQAASASAATRQTAIFIWKAPRPVPEGQHGTQHAVPASPCACDQDSLCTVAQSSPGSPGRCQSGSRMLGAVRQTGPRVSRMDSEDAEWWLKLTWVFAALGPVPAALSGRRVPLTRYLTLQGLRAVPVPRELCAFDARPESFIAGYRCPGLSPGLS